MAAEYPESCSHFVAARDAASRARTMSLGNPARAALLLRASILYALSAEKAPDDLPKWKIRVWTAAVEVAREGRFRAFAAVLASRHLAKVDLEARVMREWLDRLISDGNISSSPANSQDKAG